MISRQKITVVLVGVVGLLLTPASVLADRGCAEAPQAFESELNGFFASYYELSDLVAARHPDLASVLRRSVADFEVSTKDLTAEGLVEFCGFFSEHPDFAAMPQLLASAWASLDAGKSSCPTLSREGFVGLLATTQLLRGAIVTLDTLCGSSSCLLGICAPFCAGSGVSKAVELVLAAVLEDDDYCGKLNHFELAALFAEETSMTLDEVDFLLRDADGLLPPLDAQVSSLASQASVDGFRSALVTGLADLESGVADLEVEIAPLVEEAESFRELNVRQRIEAHLQEGQVGRISTFQLPISVGGRLETVREIVADAIQASQAAGEDIDQALQFFAEGDQLLNGGQYKPAFDNYRAAYRAAVAGGSK